MTTQTANVLPPPKRTPGIELEVDYAVVEEAAGDVSAPKPDTESPFVKLHRYIGSKLSAFGAWWKQTHDEITVDLMDWGENFPLHAKNFANRATEFGQRVASVKPFGWVKPLQAWAVVHVGQMREFFKSANEQMEKAKERAILRKCRRSPLAKGHFDDKLEAVLRTIEFQLKLIEEEARKTRRDNNKWQQAFEKRLKAIEKRIGILHPEDDPPEAAGAAIGTPYFFGDEAGHQEAAGAVAVAVTPEPAPKAAKLHEIVDLHSHMFLGQPSKVWQKLRLMTGCDHNQAKEAATKMHLFRRAHTKARVAKHMETAQKGLERAAKAAASMETSRLIAEAKQAGIQVTLPLVDTPVKNEAAA